MQKKILPPTYLLFALILMAMLHFFLPLVQSSFSIWQLAGILPLALGLVLNLKADKALKVAGTTVKPFQESLALVANGFYGISRHPMYLGFVLILAGVAILMGSLSPWLVVPVFAVLMEVIFIRTEERMLEEKFGASWQDYKKRVRKWI